ncbi:hypothetical protein EV356DRAFT_119467 [Viridothelium virens]|uniref:Uncharacterized protein n=1 Tax=Viridothelium virens TaxID=1048519 RepID=A0A6A6HBH6_VIRVR|nr:hypothetical protein EV356DRAFT_119467 [Viridothelium virens]
MTVRVFWIQQLHVGSCFGFWHRTCLAAVFSLVRHWTQEWRAFYGKIPSQKAEITDPGVLHGRRIVCWLQLSIAL